LSGVSDGRQIIERAAERLPLLRGKKIHVCLRQKLTAHRGMLLSRSSKGIPVYAGCFLGKRQIVLDDSMLRTPNVLARIFLHEIFHFVWWRLGTPLRRSFEALIREEIRNKATGEMGWSAECQKLGLTKGDELRRTRRWWDYLCESFCDTAAWSFGNKRPSCELTLHKKFRAVRHRWMKENLHTRPLSL
jgi:hypothetical protein